jgi:outer membrane protein assembly factor BamA
MRLYRQGEVGAIVGNQTTRGQVWFNYLRRTRDNFFGIGPRTSDLLETNYSVESRSYNGVFSHKFNKKLEAGIYGRFSNTGSFNGESDRDPLLDTLFTGNPLAADPTRYLPGLNTNAELFHYGAYAELDLRNNEKGLTQGGYFYGRFASVDGLDNGNAFSDYGWIETELDGRVYIPILSRKTSVALRALADLKEPKRGSQIPFYELSWLGGRSYLRGFQNYRFRANNLALFQGEFRQTVWTQDEDKGVDLFAFVDGGQVWGDNRSKVNPFILANDHFLDENWRIGAGAGGQYRWNKSTAIRVDIGKTNERTQVYFSVSRGF